MKLASSITVSLLPLAFLQSHVNGFVVLGGNDVTNPICMATTDDDSNDTDTSSNTAVSSSNSGGDNKAMAFLRKIGKVGGGQDFKNALGVDEGPSGKHSSKGGKSIRKAKGAYKSCTQSGIIDDLSESFPTTCSGTRWSGITDTVMGGTSSGTLSREEYEGKESNVLRSKVRLENGGGFVQMATDLALDPSISTTVDASKFDGIELELWYDGIPETENFNVHLKDINCVRQFSSFRATFELTKGKWTTIQLPWSSFVGYETTLSSSGNNKDQLDVTALRRLGIVTIGKQVENTLALSKISFLK